MNPPMHTHHTQVPRQRPQHAAAQRHLPLQRGGNAAQQQAARGKVSGQINSQ